MRKTAAPFFLLLLITVLCFTVSCNRPAPAEIRFGEPVAVNFCGEVYIGGEVEVPGIFPLKEGDTIAGLLQIAGGLENNRGNIYCRIYFESEITGEEPQKVDLNRAPCWMLEALPGIGALTAEKIVAYRTEKGPFRHTKELMNVPGIGEATYQKVADKITVLESAE